MNEKVLKENIIETEGTGETTLPKLDKLGRAYATGRRKTSVSRVWIKHGSNKISVNGKSSKDYFKRKIYSTILEEPLFKTDNLEKLEIFLAALKTSLGDKVVNLLSDATTVLRATFMNKAPAYRGGGTILPWHQDMSSSWPITRLPCLGIWMPLRGTTTESGTLRVIPCSHSMGVIGDGHLVSDEMIRRSGFDPNQYEEILCDRGELIIFDTSLVHSSALNHSNSDRWALNVLFGKGNIKNTREDFHYQKIG